MSQDKELPRIGHEPSEGERLYYEFMDRFQDAVEACMKEGQESRMMLAGGGRTVLIIVKDAKAESSKMWQEIERAASEGKLEVKHGSTPGHTKPTELEPT